MDSPLVEIVKKNRIKYQRKHRKFKENAFIAERVISALKKSVNIKRQCLLYSKCFAEDCKSS